MESSFQFKQDIEKSFSRELSASMCGVRTGLLGFAVCVVTRQRLLKRLSQCYPVWNKNFESFCILYIYIYFLAATEAPGGGSETLKKKFGFDDIFNSYYSYSTFPVRWKTGECKKATLIVLQNDSGGTHVKDCKEDQRRWREVLVGGDITLVSLGTYLVVLVGSGVA